MSRCTSDVLTAAKEIMNRNERQFTCTKCNRIYNGGYDELVDLNQKRIDDKLELTKEEIEKDLSKDIQDMFKKHGFKIK